MPWTRIEASAPTHPKIIGLSDAGFRLWIEGLCLATQHMTDGVIPAAWMRTFTSPAAASELLDAGLWVDDPGGFKIHDYLDYQLSRGSIEEVKAKDRERKRLQAESKRNPNGIRAQRSERNPLAHSIPSHPNENTLIGGNSNRSYPQPDDERAKRIRDAARTIAARRAQGRTLGNPAAWVAVTASKLASGEHPELIDVVEANPDATAAELADLVQPLPAALKAIERPDCEQCHGSGWRSPDDTEHVEPCDHQTPTTGTGAA